MVRHMGSQLFARVNAGCHRHRSGIDGSCTLNVGRSVANDAGVLAVDRSLQMTSNILQRQSCHVITMRMVVAVSTREKEMINLEMPQFDPGALCVISSQQA